MKKGIKKGIFIVLLIIVLAETLLLLYYIGKYTEENLIVKETTKKYEDLKKDYETITSNIDPTIKKIETYETEIKESMKWFKDNAYLEEGHKLRDFLNNICIRIKYSPPSCKIKLGCLNLVNSMMWDFKYLPDTNTSLEDDKLQSIQEFLANEGGDCEDYALLYKAEYNSLLKGCLENNPKNILLESWIVSDNPNQEYIVSYQPGSVDWYLSGAEGVGLKSGYIYPNIICGNLYDLNTNEIGGHCLIAFTDQEMGSEKDIKRLIKAPIVEPQTGEYLGLIEDESSNIYLVSPSNYKSLPNSYIYEIITDKDLFLFSLEEGVWLSYSGFNNDLNQVKKTLLGLQGR
ncbi:MAG: hypothetical protein PHT54_04480 [Candidatus Nanoarchaeia archaeon]|nr:hypothetical protein [Candidatus Nanoarchaeia archaeon]